MARVLFTLICVLLFLSAPSFGDGVPRVGYVPQEINSPLEISSYLMWVKSRLPNLFSGNEDWPIDYWAIVREQYYLQKVLKKYPDYQKFLEEKQSLIHMTIQTRKTEELQKYDLQGMREKAALVHHAYPNPEAVTRAMGDYEKMLGKVRSQGMISGLISTVTDPKEKGELFKRSPTIEGLLEYFAAKNGVPASFKGELYGMAPPFTPEQILSKFYELKEAEIKIEDLKLAQFYQQNETLLTATDSSEAFRFLAQTNDKTLKGILSQYKITAPAELPKGKFKLELREMPASISLWKGCVGGDCSTTNAARFTILPSERHFFVFNGKNEVKGYLNVTLLKNQAGEPIMLIKGLNGVSITTEETKVILSRMPALAKQLGARQVLSIGKESHINQLNFEAVQNGFSEYVDSRVRSRIPLVHPDHDIRKAVHFADNHYCDSMGESCYGYPLKDKSEPLDLETIIKEEPINIEELGMPSPLDRFESALAFKRHSKHFDDGFSSYVYHELGINQGDVENFIATLKQPSRFKVEEFKKALAQSVRTKEGLIDESEALSRLQYVYDRRVYKCRDAYSGSLFEKQMSELGRRIRNGHASSISTTLSRASVSDVKNWIVKNLKRAASLDDFREINSILQAMEKSINPDFAQLILQEYKRKLPILKKMRLGQLKDAEVVNTLQLLGDKSRFGMYEFLEESRALDGSRLEKAIANERLGTFMKSQKKFLIEALKHDRKAVYWIENSDLRQMAKWFSSEKGLLQQLAPESRGALISKVRQFCEKRAFPECREFELSFSVGEKASHLNMNEPCLFNMLQFIAK